MTSKTDDDFKYDVGCEFEDPKSALQMGFQGQKSATNSAGGVGGN